MSPGPLQRRNYAGRTVTLAEGLAVWALATVGAARAPARADGPVLLVVGALGLVDDIVEPTLRRAGREDPAKGLRGHFTALASGRLTTGAVKALGLPLAALAGAAAAPPPRGGALVLADAALIAGAANLANLLDLRPGRALKGVLAASALLALLPGNGGAAGLRERSGRDAARLAVGLSAAAAPADLAERGMLGDTGANALGALVGIAASRLLDAPPRLAVLAGITALTLASERVSFSRVIDAVPALRALDRLGRRPVPPPEAAEPTGAGR